MNILVAVIIGFFAGLLARILMPGKSVAGFIMTTLLGIAGALVGKLTGQALGFYRSEDAVGFLGAVLGAMLILFFYNLIASKNKK